VCSARVSRAVGAHRHRDRLVVRNEGVLDHRAVALLVGRRAAMADVGDALVVELAHELAVRVDLAALLGEVLVGLAEALVLQQRVEVARRAELDDSRHRFAERLVLEVVEQLVVAVDGGVVLEVPLDRLLRLAHQRVDVVEELRAVDVVDIALQRLPAQELAREDKADISSATENDMSEVEKLLETRTERDGVVRVESWPEGLVLWVGGEIKWKQWETLALTVKIDASDAIAALQAMSAHQQTQPK
jgi:hypothetical protein